MDGQNFYREKIPTCFITPYYPDTKIGQLHWVEGEEERKGRQDRKGEKEVKKSYTPVSLVNLGKKS